MGAKECVCMAESTDSSQQLWLPCAIHLISCHILLLGYAVCQDAPNAMYGVTNKVNSYGEANGGLLERKEAVLIYLPTSFSKEKSRIKRGEFIYFHSTDLEYHACTLTQAAVA